MNHKLVSTRTKQDKMPWRDTTQTHRSRTLEDNKTEHPPFSRTRLAVEGSLNFQKLQKQANFLSTVYPNISRKEREVVLLWLLRCELVIKGRELGHFHIWQGNVLQIKNIHSVNKPEGHSII